MRSQFRFIFTFDIRLCFLNIYDHNRQNNDEHLILLRLDILILKIVDISGDNAMMWPHVYAASIL